MTRTPDPAPDIDPVVAKHVHALRSGFAAWPSAAHGLPPAMGDARWPAELILAHLAAGGASRHGTASFRSSSGPEHRGAGSICWASAPCQRKPGRIPRPWTLPSL